MPEVYLALGSNIGDSKGNIKQAIQLLSSQLNNIQKAPIYRSKAVGYTNQPDFLNTALRAKTQLKPKELLQFLKETEQQVGRVERFEGGPREIDIDIIFYGNQIIQTKGLTIPHPAYKERDFVLKPLLNLNAILEDPETHKPISQLLAEIKLEKRSIADNVD